MTRYTPTPIARARHISRALAALSFAAVAFALLAAGTASADQPLVLREQIRVSGELVTLGDMFENAGDAAGTAVFRSPELGTTGVVAAARVAAAAQKHGQEWPNPGGISEVVVHRPGRLVTLDEINKVIASGAAEENEAWTVSLSRGSQPYYIDPRVEAPVTVKHLDLQPNSGAFRAVIAVEDPAVAVPERTFTGRAFASVEAVVPARQIDRGATIVADDLTTVSLPRGQVSNAAIEDMETAVGMAAKSRLVAGRPIRHTDLEPPKLVERNGLVTIVYKVPGLLLKAKGRALADGSKGQTVQVENLQSKRTLEAEVTGYGLVSVSTAQPFAQPGPGRTASHRARPARGKTAHFVR